MPFTSAARTSFLVQPSSWRNGDGLWPEFETVSFDQAENAPYRRVVKELATLSHQLHGQTKMESLMKWQAANPSLSGRRTTPRGGTRNPSGLGLARA